MLRAQSAERVQDNLDHLATLELGDAGAGALADARTRLAGPGCGAGGARWRRRPLADIDARAEALLAAAEALTDALEASGGAAGAAHRQPLRAPAHARAAPGQGRAAGVDASGAARPRGRLAPTMDAFEAALLELEHAPLSSPEIRAALAAARDEWLRLVRGVRDADSAEGRAALVRSSEALVDTFERAHGRRTSTACRSSCPELPAAGGPCSRAQAATFSTCAWRV